MAEALKAGGRAVEAATWEALVCVLEADDCHRGGEAGGKEAGREGGCICSSGAAG